MLRFAPLLAWVTTLSSCLAACERGDSLGVREAAPGSGTASARCLVPLPPPPESAPGKAAVCPAPRTPLRELERGRLRFPDSPRAPELSVERAENMADRARGLMYRTSLEEEHGMLFSWPRQGPRSFWMKDTCIPLDMLFIDQDDVIVGILEQVPTLNEAHRSVRCPSARVLEVNAGFVRRHGIEPGQRIAVDFARPAR